MKKSFRILTVLLFALWAIVLFPARARADMGPKPSVNVTFEGLGDELCYGTLLSETDSTGPYSVWDGDVNHIYNYDLDIDIWRAFAEYEDSDGFYFLQTGWRVDETKEMSWSYYPPYEFKILLYFPESDSFAVSGVYERYAFDSYFTVTMDGEHMDNAYYNGDLSSDSRLIAHRSYNYARETVSLVARIVITIAIEVGFALFLGYREKKQVMLILWVNVLTQVILNVLLNITYYTSGEVAFVLLYILLELVVFAVEALVFCRYLDVFSEKSSSKRTAVMYAFAANAMSFAAGAVLMYIIPEIF